MELKIEYLSISDLKPYDKNTRKHEKVDIDNIAKSIDKYGMCDAIGIWGKDNIIVEGHGRMLACKQLGITEVPCVRLDHLTDEQRREYAIAHNATAELSIWDKDFLAEELAVLDMSDFDFNFGIDALSDEDTDCIEDEAPEVDEENDIILDCFGGSGSTLIACEQIDRQCYMIEYEAHYCDVIIKRWETLTCEKAVLING